MLGKTVKQLLNELDSTELTEWQAYIKILNKEGAPVATQEKPADIKAAMREQLGERVVKKKKWSTK